MKVFDKDGAWNFVDDKGTFGVFRNEQDCCENFGYRLTLEDPTTTVDLFKLLNGKQKRFALSKHNFDRKFFKEILNCTLDEGAAAVFKLTRKGSPSVYLTLFNSHNGYYGHGFEVKHNGTVVNGGIL